MQRRYSKSHGVDAEGKVVFARKLGRKDLLAFFAKLPQCLAGMEACGSAHYLAREITKLGHSVKLMPHILPPSNCAAKDKCPTVSGSG